MGLQHAFLPGTLTKWLSASTFTNEQGISDGRLPLPHVVAIALAEQELDLHHALCRAYTQ